MSQKAVAAVWSGDPFFCMITQVTGGRRKNSDYRTYLSDCGWIIAFAASPMNAGAPIE